MKSMSSMHQDAEQLKADLLQVVSKCNMPPEITALVVLDTFRSVVTALAEVHGVPVSRTLEILRKTLSEASTEKRGFKWTRMK